MVSHMYNLYSNPDDCLCFLFLFPSPFCPLKYSFLIKKKKRESYLISHLIVELLACHGFIG